jgi:hypothetical protein
VFKIAEELGDQLLVTDLDILIDRNIDRMITNDDFKIIPGEHSKYNSSVFLLKAGTYKYVWDEFNPNTVEDVLNQYRIAKGVRELGSDQAWLGFCIEKAALFSKKEVNRALSCDGVIPKIAYFSGKIKPWTVAAKRKLNKFHTKYMEYLTPCLQ